MLNYSIHSHQITSIISPNFPLSVPFTLPDGGKAEVPVSFITGGLEGVLRLVSDGGEVLKIMSGHTGGIISLSFVSPPSTGGELSGAPLLVSGSWDGTLRIWDISPDSGAAYTCVETIDDCVGENACYGVGLPAPDSGIVAGTTGRKDPNANNTTNVIIDSNVRIFRRQTDVNGLENGPYACVNMTPSNAPIRSITTLPKDVGDFSADSSAMTDDLISSNSVITTDNSGLSHLRSADTGNVTKEYPYPNCTSGSVMSNDRPFVFSVAAFNSAEGPLHVTSAEDGRVAVYSTSTGQHLQTIDHPACVWCVISLPNGDFATGCQDGRIRIFTRDDSRIAEEAERMTFIKEVDEAALKSRKGPSKEDIDKLPKWEECTEARNLGTQNAMIKVFRKDGKAVAAQWQADSNCWIEIGEVTGSNENRGTINGVTYDHVLPIEFETPGGGVQTLQIGHNEGSSPWESAQRFLDENNMEQQFLGQVADYIVQRVGDAGSSQTIDMTGDAESTAAANSRPNAPAPPPPAPLKHIPMKSPHSFPSGVATLSKVLNKILSSPSSDSFLNSSDRDALTTLCDTLTDTSHYHSRPMPSEGLRAASKILASFPLPERFPAADLLRLAVLHPGATTSARNETTIRESLQVTLDALLDEKVGPTDLHPLPLCSFRLVANLAKSFPVGSKLVKANSGRVLDACVKFSRSDNKNTRLAVATVVANLCHSVRESGAGSEGGGEKVVIGLLKAINGMIGREGEFETEAIKRLLIGAGSLLVMRPIPGIDVQAVIEHAREIVKGVDGTAHFVESDAVREIVQEIKTLLP